MNIRTKLILSVGILAGMIILLVALSVVNLQILTATEPDSPAAMPGLERALLWISVTGAICILASIVLLVWLPRSINKPIQELTRGILEIANHNYEKRLNMSGHEEFRQVADSFNSMAERLTEYRASTLNDILSAKKFLEAVVNSIHEPIIGLNCEHEILFINKEALTVLNLKREDVIRHSAEELSLKNDLLRRLVRELITPGEKKEPLKIYADNKESYFQASYITIINTDADTDEPQNLGDVILLKNASTKSGFAELDTNYVSGGYTNWFTYALVTGMNFAGGIYIILSGVRMILAEIVPAFKGIADKLVPNAKPAIDCPVVFPYAPNAVLIGFLVSFVGGIVGMFILFGIKGAALAAVPIILPGVVPHFFCGATAGVFANAEGGLKGCIVGAFFHGLLITFLPVFCMPVLGALHYAGTTFSDADFCGVGIILGNIARFTTGNLLLIVCVILFLIPIIYNFVAKKPAAKAE